MADDLSQLDGLMESDMLEALGKQPITVKQSSEDIKIEIDDFNDAIDSIDIKDIQGEKQNRSEEENLSKSLAIEDVATSKSTNSDVSAIKTDDLASLLSQLLNNKTIEITIKIKD